MIFLFSRIRAWDPFFPSIIRSPSKQSNSPVVQLQVDQYYGYLSSSKVHEANENCSCFDMRRPLVCSGVASLGTQSNLGIRVVFRYFSLSTHFLENTKHAISARWLANASHACHHLPHIVPFWSSYEYLIHHQSENWALAHQVVIRFLQSCWLLSLEWLMLSSI